VIITQEDEVQDLDSQPFNNSCLVFAVDVLDVNFALEQDTGLAE
jgi:hypothetical protein